MKVKSESEVAQSCPTLRDPMDWDFPGKSTGVGCHRLLRLKFSKTCLFSGLTYGRASLVAQRLKRLPGMW